MGYHQFYSNFMCQSKLSSSITFSRYVIFCCSWVLSIFTMNYQFSNSGNDLFFEIYYSSVVVCYEAKKKKEKKLYLIKSIHFGINFVNILNESKYVFMENIVMININQYHLVVFQKMYLLLLILFTNKKCHGYTFLMFFNLLDLLVNKS